MTKRKRRTEVAQPSGPLQRLYDRMAAQETMSPLVSAFAVQHGKFEPAAKTGPMRHAWKNCGGTTLDRWQRENLLSDSQLAAILHVQHLWRMIDQGQRLVANLDRTVFGCPGDGNSAEIEARSDLHHIKTGFPHEYWDVFERVCRFDEPAGTAGSRMANYTRSSAEAARLIVCMIADMIAMRERLSYRY